MPSRRQWLIVLASALVVAVILAAFWLWNKQRSSAEAPVKESAAQAPIPGVFRPTSTQLAALKILPVASLVFRSEDLADGKIAINNDKTTPVF